MFGDPVMFSLYWIFLYAQIVVTIGGIIVGLQTREVYRLHEWVDVEYDFNVGHWHVLAVLLAVLVILIAINHFKPEKGRMRSISGWLLGIGGSWAFTFANLYMMRSPFKDKMPLMILTFVGVWILILGFATGIYTILKAYKKERKQMKEI